MVFSKGLLQSQLSHSYESEKRHACHRQQKSNRQSKDAGASSKEVSVGEERGEIEIKGD